MYIKKYVVLIKKHYTGEIMRLGVYNSLEAAEEARSIAACINTVDKFYVDLQTILE